MKRKGCTIWDINRDVEENYLVLLNYDQEEETAEGYVMYKITNRYPFEVSLSKVWIGDDVEDDKFWLNKMMECALEQIYEVGAKPVAGCKEAEEYMKQLKIKEQENEEKVYLREIEPQTNDGSKKLAIDSEYLFIEYPVRAAVKEMNRSGMRTIMSSSNKEDVEGCGHIEANDNGNIYISQNTHFPIGNGYAWIMVDYRTLSKEIKQNIIDLNGGKVKIPISDKAKSYFEENCTANECEMAQNELVKFYRVRQMSPSEDQDKFPSYSKMAEEIESMEEEYRRAEVIIAERRKKFSISPTLRKKLFKYKAEMERYKALSDEDKYFEANMTGLYHENSLSYNGNDYKAVVFRYPVGEDTTVEEVQQYFQELIRLLVRERNQMVEISLQQFDNGTSDEYYNIKAIENEDEER